jgi:pilus assembly protein TadC
MTALLVAGIGLAMTSIRWQAVIAIAGAMAAVLAEPGLVLPMGAMAGLIAAGTRWRKSRHAARAASRDAAALCDLTAVGLTGGLGLHASLQLAANEIGGNMATEVSAVLRRARIDGIAPALASSDGAGRRLYRTAARAAVTGSALVEPVVRLADEMNAEQAVLRLEAVRRLPVLMLFPLTLLILPGFLLLVIAPSFIDGFSRLGL